METQSAPAPAAQSRRQGSKIQKWSLLPPEQTQCQSRHLPQEVQEIKNLKSLSQSFQTSNALILTP